MPGYVSIANLAAQKLGEDDRLTDPDDNTLLGRSVAAVWNEMRRAVLREHPWNCAMKRWQLASRVVTAPETILPWLYAFPLPEDLLRLHEVIEPVWPRDAWQLEGNDILAMEPGPLLIRGVRDLTETGQFDDLLVEAFAFRLAFQIADRITGDRQRRADMWDGYRTALMRAKIVDGRENPPIPSSFEDSTWVLARFGE
jgi:hypothetical protein